MNTITNPTVSDLLIALKDHNPSSIRMILPDGEAVPSHFHVTEVGRIQKDFIDCGGTKRRELRGQLQLLVATDFEHRLSSEKLLKIIEMSASILGEDPLPIFVEYGQKVAVVYTVPEIQVSADSIQFQLSSPQTGCLAADTCGLSNDEAGLFTVSASVCTPGSGCCN